MREVFRQRSFQKIFFSNLFSGFGQGMSIIGISWYLVNQAGSAHVLGTTMFISSILFFFIGPYLGTLIDRFSRKNLLLFVNGLGFVVLGFCAVWGFALPYQDWMLILIYMVTLFINQIHYPTQSALVQESFTDRHYNDINSLLEIESQTASVLAGGVAGIFLEQLGLPIVLLFDGLTYLFAFGLISTLDYRFTLAHHVKANAGKNWWSQLHDSWLFIRGKRGFLVFGTTAMLPFVAVMVGNLLAPVWVNQTLHANVIIFSTHEMTYAVGAVAAGFLVMHMTRRFGALAAMVGNMVMFSLVLGFIVMLPYGWMFVFLTTFIGWGNTSVRLIRQNVYMRIVPKQHMGRVLSFFQSVGMFVRLILLGSFTLMIDITGAGAAYLVLAFLVILGALGCFFSMRSLLTEDSDQALHLNTVEE
ncbi:MFS transporter [Brevibacillus ginsengisoli]|uniref:MFS transporter n=1 Tax=Brevibacillus ginsengisoli TaxID=363854 RepID=UPI003CE6EA19